MVSYTVREARIDDINDIHTLALELVSESVYKGIPMDDQQFKRMVATSIGSRSSIVFVVVDSNDKPVGFLIGMVEQLFWSRKKFASDLCTYVRPEARHVGGFMVRRFIRWAKKMPGVVEVTLGLSSGIGDTERIGMMYERMGLSRVGGLYVMRTESCQA